MGTVQKLAAKVKEGLQTALPKLRKTVISKLALAVGAGLTHEISIFQVNQPLTSSRSILEISKTMDLK